jgi:hypothetical protein
MFLLIPFLIRPIVRVVRRYRARKALTLSEHPAQTSTPE